MMVGNGGKCDEAEIEGGLQASLSSVLNLLFHYVVALGLRFQLQ